MVIKQYEVFLINLDPTIGHEVKKSRPCIIISPDEMNQHLRTVMIAPLTTKSHDFPTRISIKFQRKNGWIMLDQIRTVDKSWLIKRLGVVESKTARQIKAVIKEMLVD